MIFRHPIEGNVRFFMYAMLCNGHPAPAPVTSRLRDDDARPENGKPQSPRSHKAKLLMLIMSPCLPVHRCVLAPCSCSAREPQPPGASPGRSCISASAASCGATGTMGRGNTCRPQTRTATWTTARFPCGSTGKATGGALWIPIQLKD